MRILSHYFLGNEWYAHLLFGQETYFLRTKRWNTKLQMNSGRLRPTQAETTKTKRIKKKLKRVATYLQNKRLPRLVGHGLPSRLLSCKWVLFHGRALSRLLDHRRVFPWKRATPPFHRRMNIFLQMRKMGCCSSLLYTDRDRYEACVGILNSASKKYSTAHKQSCEELNNGARDTKLEFNEKMRVVNRQHNIYAWRGVLLFIMKQNKTSLKLTHKKKRK